MNTTAQQSAAIAQVTGRVLAHVAAGMDIRSAIDAVFGSGHSAKMIDDLYIALRAKACA